MGVCFDHRVEYDEEFPHAGHEDDLGEFALSFQSVGKRANHGVAPVSCQGRHVQHASDGATTTEDRSAAAELSAIAVKWSDANQRRNLLPVELSEFGDFGDQSGHGDLADSGCTLKKFDSAFPLVVGFHQPGDLGIDPTNFFGKLVHDLLQAFANNLRGGGARAIFLGRSRCDQLTSPGDQLVEFILFFVELDDGSQPDLLSKISDQACVDPVCFGGDSECFGEVADLPRVDDRYQITSIDQFQNNVLFVTPMASRTTRYDSAAGSFFSNSR